MPKLTEIRPSFLSLSLEERLKLVKEARLRRVEVRKEVINYSKTEGKGKKPAKDRKKSKKKKQDKIEAALNKLTRAQVDALIRTLSSKLKE